jgi:hypothetical protein
MNENFEKRIKEEAIRGIFRYWLDRCSPGSIPQRGCIDPTTIPYQYLPNLFLYERDESQRFRCKLVGTDLVRVLGRDDTGHFLDETHCGPCALERQKLFTKAIETALPVYYRCRGVTALGQQRTFSSILLPVASSDGRPSQIFGMMLYGPLEVPTAFGKAGATADWLADVAVAGYEDLADDQARAVAV